MLIILSPAKTLDFESCSTISKCSQPGLLPLSKKLISSLKKMNTEEISQLMQISPKLAELNKERFGNWSISHELGNNSKQAILAFKGDVYEGMKAWEFKKEDFEYAQTYLRLLSGLYGILRPLDLIQAHRLEMGTTFANHAGKDLYAYWGDLLREKIEQDLKSSKSDVIINLASQEYFKATQPNQLNARVISPVFKDEKNGKFKIISFYAKKARGMMSSFIIKNRIKSVEEIKEFSDNGYRFDPSQSSDLKPVFTRTEVNRIAA